MIWRRTPVVSQQQLYACPVEHCLAHGWYYVRPQCPTHGLFMNEAHMVGCHACGAPDQLTGRACRYCGKPITA